MKLQPSPRSSFTNPATHLSAPAADNERISKLHSKSGLGSAAPFPSVRSFPNPRIAGVSLPFSLEEINDKVSHSVEEEEEEEGLLEGWGVQTHITNPAPNRA